MDSPEHTEQIELDVARLRTVLRDNRSVPLGMVSRLQAAVVREAEDDGPAGWESRMVVACLAYVVLGGGGTPTIAPDWFAPASAVIAVAYVWLASGTGKRTLGRPPVE